MDVILREDVQHLGRAGEIVTVKGGYARNYLIPKGLAYFATAANRQRVEAERKRREERLAADRTAAEAQQAKLADVSLTFSVKTAEGEKLFGSITAHDIATKLQELGFDIDKRRIELDEPIKLVGIYKIPIRLDAGVRAEIRVWVVKE